MNVTDKPPPIKYAPLDEAPRNGEQSRRKPKPKARFQRTCTNKIMATQFEPLKAMVPGYAYEGFTILAGRQKLGKTWLAIDWAIARATGGIALGSIPCEPGDVLYIDLENGHRRIQRRIDTIFPNEPTRPDLSRLEWVTEAPMLNAGFIDACEDWRRSVAEPSLIVIDVIQRVKPAGKPGQTAYEADYAAYMELQRWATESRLCVLGLHHTKKGREDDPLEGLSGSNGLSAVADTTLVLDRDANGMTLYVRGRDVEEKETALRFDGGVWSLLGEAADVRRSDERGEILSALLIADAPMTPSELVAATGMKRNNLDQLLFKLGNAGEIQKVKRGEYIHPERSDLLPPLSPHKKDKKVRNEDGGEADG